MFEAVVYLDLVLGVAASLLAYQESEQEITQSEMVFIVGGTVGLNVLFVWLIAYRASTVAKWIFVAFTLIGAAVFVIDLAMHPPPANLVEALTASVYLLAAVEIVLLFRRDARDWFAGRQQVDPGIFG